MRLDSRSGQHSGKRLYFTVPLELWHQMREAEAKQGKRWFEAVRAFLQKWTGR